MKILSTCLYFFIFGPLINGFQMRTPKRVYNSSHMKVQKSNKSIANNDSINSNFTSTFDSIEKSLNVSHEQSSLCLSIPWNSTERKCMAKNNVGCCIGWQEPCIGKNCMIKCSFKLSDIICIYC